MVMKGEGDKIPSCQGHKNLDWQWRKLIYHTNHRSRAVLRMDFRNTPSYFLIPCSLPAKHKVQLRVVENVST